MVDPLIWRTRPPSIEAIEEERDEILAFSEMNEEEVRMGKKM
jgi:hypothetical protein